MSLKKFNLLQDIYYSDSYISLYLKENEKIFTFEYKEDNNIFINKALKRPILKIGTLNLNDNFYDLETAYGYGGFYTNSDDKQFIKKAMKSYEKNVYMKILLLNLLILFQSMELLTIQVVLKIFY